MSGMSSPGTGLKFIASSKVHDDYGSALGTVNSSSLQKVAIPNTYLDVQNMPPAGTKMLLKLHTYLGVMTSSTSQYMNVDLGFWKNGGDMVDSSSALDVVRNLSRLSDGNNIYHDFYVYREFIITSDGNPATYEAYFRAGSSDNARNVGDYTNCLSLWEIVE